MRLPSSLELGAVRELAEITLVDHALRVLDAVVGFEHPTLEEPHPGDPASLLAARRVRAASRALRRELRRYRAAALAALQAECDELPF
ncbi:MAG: hypothetical protein L6Q76_19755 [Polyangiaceae bacterium]|nr:hypothetical protein [Polyangiaceae bacterium]